MKKFLTILIMGFMLGCQKDEEKINQDLTQNLTVSSPLISLISRVCQSKTASDDIIDGCSCFAVKLPVQITVDGQQLNVVSDADYQMVSAIFGQSDDDNDIVNFQFPVTIIYPDSHEVVVNTNQQLTQLSHDCSPGGFHEISCISFNFPISINHYNSNSQSAGSTVFLNNEQLFEFLDNLSDADLITISYPITIRNPYGMAVAANNNLELENLIESAIESCGEHGPDNPGARDLSEIITLGNWHISYFFHESNQTFEYAGYSFTFSANGTFTATEGMSAVNGDWDFHNDGDHDQFNLHFNSGQFHELERDWRVVEFDDSEFHLKNQIGGDRCDNSTTSRGDDDGLGENEYLYFAKN